MSGEGRDGETGGARGELVPVRPPGSVREWAEQLVARAHEDGVALTGEGGVLTDLMRHVLQTGLEVEMSEHLGPRRTSGRAAGRVTRATALTTRPSRPRSARSSCACRATGRAPSIRSWCRSTSDGWTVWRAT